MHRFFMIHSLKKFHHYVRVSFFFICSINSILLFHCQPNDWPCTKQKYQPGENSFRIIIRIKEMQIQLMIFSFAFFLFVKICKNFGKNRSWLPRVFSLRVKSKSSLDVSENLSISSSRYFTSRMNRLIIIAK